MKVLSLALASTVLLACTGGKKSTEQVVNAGDTERTVRVKVVDSSDLASWMSDPSSIPAKVTPLDANDSPLAYADGKTTGDVEFTTFYDYGFNGGLFQVQDLIVQFKLPLEAKGFTLNFDNVPMRSCSPDPATVKLTQIYDSSLSTAEQDEALSDFSIKSGCVFSLPGTGSGLDSALTVRFNGKDTVVTPDASGNASFALTGPQYTYVRTSGSEDYFNNNKSRLVTNKVFEQNSLSVSDASQTVSLVNAPSNCTLAKSSFVLSTQFIVSGTATDTSSGQLTPSITQHHVLDPVQITCSPRRTIGGTVQNLNGTIVLQNNSGDNLTVTTSSASNSNFVFATPIDDGGTYSVSVLTQPSGQICSVSSGSGTAAANVSGVTVSCVNQYSLGGTVSGLPNGQSVILMDFSAPTAVKFVTVNANGAFTFPGTRSHGWEYDIRIQSQPSGATCVGTLDLGTMTGNVTNVTITCS